MKRKFGWLLLGASGHGKWNQASQTVQTGLCSVMWRKNVLNKIKSQSKTSQPPFFLLAEKHRVHGKSLEGFD